MDVFNQSRRQLHCPLDWSLSVWHWLETCSSLSQCVTGWRPIKLKELSANVCYHIVLFFLTLNEKFLVPLLSAGCTAIILTASSSECETFLQFGISPDERLFLSSKFRASSLKFSGGVWLQLSSTDSHEVCKNSLKAPIETWKQEKIKTNWSLQCTFNFILLQGRYRYDPEHYDSSQTDLENIAQIDDDWFRFCF